MSKPCAFELQGLKDHIKGVEKVANAFIEASNLHRVAAKRLGISDPELVKGYMLLAAKAHDLGKALEYYQNQFDDSCRAIKSFNFINHEVYSATILLAKENEVMKVFGRCKLCFVSAVAAVLLHHHAMRVHDSREIKDSYKKYLSMLGKVIKGDLEDVIEFPLPESVNGTDLSWLFNKLDEIYSSSSRSYLYFLTPLVIADYADSFKRENSKKRTFSLIVLDILEEWGVKG